MKTCVTCGQQKALKDFNRRAASSDGRQARCRACSQAWYASHRESHLATVRQRVRRVRADNQQRLAAYLAENVCVDCGECDIRALDFDHREGIDKRADIARMVGDGLSWQAIETEIAKCDVRCANCHRRRTVEGGRWWRQSYYELGAEDQKAQSARRLARVFLTSR